MNDNNIMYNDGFSRKIRILRLVLKKKRRKEWGHVEATCVEARAFAEQWSKTTLNEFFKSIILLLNVSTEFQR